jgi:two-component system C4-dicarboxylate transport sensor histidine kinase DctB
MRTFWYQLLWSALAAVILGVGIWTAYLVVTGHYLRDGQARAETKLRLAVLGLDSHLRRFRAAPGLLADDPRLLQALETPEPETLGAASDWLQGQAILIDATDIMLIDDRGTVLAASDHMRPDSLVSQNLGDRAHISQALSGRPAQVLALGDLTGTRDFTFAMPVRDTTGAVAGVVTVAVNLDEIEAEWRRADEVIAVTDTEGIVFLATVAEWLFRSLSPLDPALRAEIAAEERYGDTELTDLGETRRSIGGVTVITMSKGEETQDFVGARVLMPLADWTVHVLLPTGPFVRQARLATISGLLLLGVLAAGATLVAQRRARLAEQIRITEQARAELEVRVSERTSDLARLNLQLAAEVAERTATEDELRRTQADLIQAGKLAALGQVSAALSHEINQPLAAVRNYADSAGILIDRGDADRAKGNLAQIMALVDRMAAIARHLRQVARKPDRPLSDVALAVVVEDALATSAPRLAAAGATVSCDLTADLPLVRAGPVRLAQVLVNLISNAADAVEGQPRRDITIAARHTGDRVLITVADSGPGVPPAIVHRVFDPFFTTKSVGAGLGLGLSISYNIAKDFGGDLRIGAAPGGGAMFILELAAVR